MPNSPRHNTVGPLWETWANAVLTFLDWDFSFSRVIFLTIFFFQALKQVLQAIKKMTNLNTNVLTGLCNAEQEKHLQIFLQLY